MKKTIKLLLLVLGLSQIIACAGAKQAANTEKISAQPVIKKVGEYEILLGGFHDHWKRTGQDNPALFMAAMDYYHYDFSCLMGGDSIWDPMTKKGIEAYSDKKIYLGYEQTFGWGHVVTVHNHPKKMNNTNPDFRAEFEKMKAGSGFVAMAHPASHPASNKQIFMTGDMEKMLYEEGLIDAWQPELKESEIDLIKKTNAQGKVVPIVSGWDVHYVVDIPDLPAVLYTKKRSPFGHLDSGGRYRSIVIDAKNNFESTMAAVRAGRSVIEDLRPGPNFGKLYGEKKWVDYLQKNGYRKLISSLDTERDQHVLTVDKDFVEVGKPLVLTFSAPCEVRLPGSLTKPDFRKTDKNGILKISKMPALLDRALTFYPVVAVYNDGHEQDYVITLHHKFSYDVYPKQENGKYYLRVVLSEKMKGNCSTIVAGQALGIQPFDGKEVLLDISQLDLDFAKAVSFKMSVEDNQGVKRSFESYVNFTTAPMFNRDWSEISSVFINTAAQEIAPGYGTTRPFPGADVISADVKFAWTKDYFLMQAKVIDKTNYNPFMSSKSYQGDVIQFGVDPMLRRKKSLGNNHSFNLSLSPKGPFLWRWKSAADEKSSTFTPLKEDYSLGDEFLSIKKWEKGLIYELKLPWSQLGPAKPAVGKQLGVFVLLANNDGEGFLDMFGWPKQMPNGGYLKPNTWGFLTLAK